MTTAERERNIFWNMFEEELARRGDPFEIRHRTHYATVDQRSASSNYCLSVDFLIQKRFIRVGIYMRDDIPAFEQIYTHKDEIENLLGFHPRWTQRGETNPNTRRIEVHIPFIPHDIYSYASAIDRTIEYIQQFKRVIPLYSPKRLFDW